MGTQGAYGGSGGWNGTRRDTEDWLSGGAGSGSDGERQAKPIEGEDSGDGEGQGADTPDEGASPEQGPKINPDIGRLLGGVVRKLSRVVDGPSGGAGHSGAGPKAQGSGGGRGGGGRRAAARSGGAAIAGVYGLRSGDQTALADIGLSLVELEGLDPFEQAMRIVEAASGPRRPIEEDEIREVNAAFIWQSLEQDEPLAAAELVKLWVTEFVFRVWLTESGSVLRDGSRDGAHTHAIEREVRSTLVAAVSRIDFSTDGVRASDFQAAVSRLMDMLERIFTEAAA